MIHTIISIAIVVMPQNRANVVFVLLLVNEYRHLIQILQNLYELFLRSIALRFLSFNKVGSVRGQNVAEKLFKAVSHHVGFEEFVAGVNRVVEELVQNLILL